MAQSVRGCAIARMPSRPLDFSLWTSPCPCAKLAQQKRVPREGLHDHRNVGRILPAILAALFVLAAGPAQAEIKKGLDRLHPRHQEAQRLCRPRRRQERQAPRDPDDPCARGHDAKDARRSPRCGRSSATSRSPPTSSAMAKACCRRTSRRCRRRPRSSASDRPLTRARTQAGWDALVKHPLVDAGRIALDRLLLRRRRRGRVRLDRRAACAQRLHPRLVREEISRRLGEEREGPLPDPARRRGRRLSADHGADRDRRPARRQGAVPIRGL